MDQQQNGQQQNEPRHKVVYPKVTPRNFGVGLKDSVPSRINWSWWEILMVDLNFRNISLDPGMVHCIVYKTKAYVR